MKFIVNQDVDEIIQVQGSIHLISPPKDEQLYLIVMEFFAGKKQVYKTLGWYQDETKAKATFRSIIDFLKTDLVVDGTDVFSMPED